MKLAAIFTDGMVLQRDISIRVFGTGDGVAEVNFLGEKVTAESKDGKWCAELSPRMAGGPYEMEVSLNDEKTLLKDILIGDVYIASGQSNMEFPLMCAQGGFDDAKLAENDKIRLFTVPRRYKKGDDCVCWHFVACENKDTPWQKCNEATALEFTALGYYMAKYINEATDVPVGVISCNWGGRRIESFISRDYCKDEPALSGILEKYNELLDKLDMEEYEEKYQEFKKVMANYCFNIKPDMREYSKEYSRSAAVVKEAWADDFEFRMPLFEEGPYDSISLGTIWEAMFEPITPFGVKGLLWYQGEANAGDYDYDKKYLAFLKCLRSEFKCDMDAYAVELAPWVESVPAYLEEPRNKFVEDIFNWAFVREQQQKAVDDGEKNYLITTQELGNIADIHPHDKKSVAKRMAKKVLKYTYGMDVVADQPIYRKAEFKDGKAYLTFDNAEGLFGDPNLVVMYIGGNDKVLYRAKTEILPDNRLLVYSDEVKEPAVVRYAFDMYYFGGYYYNGAGLPMAPFRTDK